MKKSNVISFMEAANQRRWEGKHAAHARVVYQHNLAYHAAADFEVEQAKVKTEKKKAK